MTDKQIIIDGKECRYWFRPNPDDYKKCALRGKYDNCDEIKDCYIKELLGKLALKEQECEELKKECNEYFELMAIRTEVLAKNKEIFNKIEQLKTSKEQAEQKLNRMREYCKYITAFNNANKTNKGLDVEEVIQIIDEVE